MEIKSIDEVIFEKLNIQQITQLFKTFPNLFYGLNKRESLPLEDKIKKRLKRINILRGGFGDRLTIKDVNLNELEMGIAVEYEHIGKPSQSMSYKKIETIVLTAMDIAFDHLIEIPDYYTRLLKMEKQGELFWESRDWNLEIEKSNRKILKSLLK